MKASTAFWVQIQEVHCSTWCDAEPWRHIRGIVLVNVMYSADSAYLVWTCCPLVSLVPCESGLAEENFVQASSADLCVAWVTMPKQTLRTKYEASLYFFPSGAWRSFSLFVCVSLSRWCEALFCIYDGHRRIIEHTADILLESLKYRPWWRTHTHPPFHSPKSMSGVGL